MAVEETTSNSAAAANPSASPVSRNDESQSNGEVKQEFEECAVDLSPHETKRVLRNGKFKFQQTDASGETVGDFVFVPDAFDFTGKEGMMQILSALDIEAPTFAFRVDANYGLAPENEENMRTIEDWANWAKEISKKPHPTKKRADPSPKTVKESGNEVWIQSILESVSPDGSMFLITEPYGGNSLARIAAEAASRKNIISLALLTCEDDWSVNSISYVPLKNANGAKTNNHKEFHLTGVDPKRRLVPSEFFISHSLNNSTNVCTVPMGEMPKHAIKVDFDYTEEEKRTARNCRKGICIPGILADECSHCLVFEKRSSLLKFRKTFSQIFKCGVLATGDSKSEMELVYDALFDSAPLIILEGTGPVANIVKQYRDGKSDGEVGEFFAADLDGQDRFDAILKAYELLDQAKFALPRKQPNDNLVTILTKEKNAIGKAQKKLSRLMACSGEQSNEKEQDVCAVKFCCDLIRATGNAQFRYFWIAFGMQMVIEFSYLTSIVTAVDGIESMIAMVKEDTYKATELAIGAIFVLTVMRTLFQYVDPLSKHGNLLVATHRLTAEKFRFQTKTGCYSDTYSIANVNPRGKFLDKCNMIYSTCMNTEMREGYMNLCCFGNSFPSLDDETSEGENNALTKGDDIFSPASADDNAKKSAMIGSLAGVFRSRNSVVSAQKTKANAKERHVKKKDAGEYGAMTIETYMVKRLNKSLKEFDNASSQFAIFRNLCYLLVFAFTATGTVLTPLNHQKWVPLMLALATATKVVQTLSLH